LFVCNVRLPLFNMLLNETTKTQINLPKNSSLVNYSVLKQFFCDQPFRSFSIKHVISGKEYYKVNSKNYCVQQNEFLIVNKHSEGSVVVDSKVDVKGLCIDVSPELISLAVSSVINPQDKVHQSELNTYLNSPDFLECKYDAYSNSTGRFLNDAANLQNFKKFQRIKAVKSTTKKELLRKLLLAQNLINSNFLNINDINEVALYCGISEYHFYRLFKHVFQISPYQLLLKNKLNYGRQLLGLKTHSISQVADMAGFANVASFSKAFKKEFRLNPSARF
jgi:AraC family transcriptional regulator